MNNVQVNGLALCTGIGGLDLGIGLVLPSYRVVCHVEREAYAISVLVHRMEEGFISKAPVYPEVESFPAREWRGKVDIITSGFPCQPFSVAGKRECEDDSRYIWPSIAKIVEECYPALVFLENTSIRAFVEPFRDLRGMGFALLDPFACTAAELGAGHYRRRVFVLAYRDRERGLQRQGAQREEWKRAQDSTTRHTDHSDDGSGQRPGKSPEASWKPWWASEPSLERVVHGAPHRVDRDRALGNAVVPQMAAFAFWTLFRRLTALPT